MIPILIINEMSKNSVGSPSNEDIINEVTKQVFSNNDENLGNGETLGVDNLNIDDDNESNSDAEVPDEEPQQNLSEEEQEKNHQEALEFKFQGNTEFKEERYLESANFYTKGIKICPIKYSADRAILFANRAASKVKLGRIKSAIEDCTKAIELNDKYLKAYLRRATLYEQSDKLDESLADYNKILELDPRNGDALQAQIRLPPKINERNEKLKTEMLGKMKDLGNLILRPFGLSTENFQVNQDPNTGSYSVNFRQNSS